MGNGYSPTTRSGRNLYEILSLLQKAIRRGDVNLAGYAAYETSDKFRSALWNRIMTVGSEDCWGAVSKELENLRSIDESVEGGTDWTIGAAVSMLCQSLKSRDACYFACNFVLSPNNRETLDISVEDIEDATDYAYGIHGFMTTHSFLHTGEIPAGNPSRKNYTRQELRSGAGLNLSLKRLDIENAGHYIDLMRKKNRDLVWKVLIGFSVRYGGGLLTKEVLGLKLNDDRVNRNKSGDKKDEIYICKAALMLMYQRCGMFDTLRGVDGARETEFVDWFDTEIPIYDIASCVLPDTGIPEYVYDVHTSKGKREGKTDWEMNIVEHAALNPLQPSFFDNGSWAPRYDVKHTMGWCTEGEYQESLEYRKTHEDNPMSQIMEALRFDGIEEKVESCISGDPVVDSIRRGIMSYPGKQSMLFV